MTVAVLGLRKPGGCKLRKEALPAGSSEGAIDPFQPYRPPKIVLSLAYEQPMSHTWRARHLCSRQVSFSEALSRANLPVAMCGDERLTPLTLRDPGPVARGEDRRGIGDVTLLSFGFASASRGHGDFHRARATGACCRCQLTDRTPSHHLSQRAHEHRQYYRHYTTQKPCDELSTLTQRRIRGYE
jgi:hypothetical protein